MGVFPYLMWVGTYLLCVVRTLLLVEMNLFSVCNVGLIKFLNSMVFRCSYLVLKSGSFDSGLMCSGIDPFCDF
jgi:hypothetical protein